MNSLPQPWYHPSLNSPSYRSPNQVVVIVYKKIYNLTKKQMVKKVLMDLSIHPFIVELFYMKQRKKQNEIKGHFKDYFWSLIGQDYLYFFNLFHLYIFFFQQMKVILQLSILLILFSAAYSQDFITGLNIDPQLIEQANDAIQSLHNQLSNYIRCKQVYQKRNLQTDNQKEQNRCFKKLSGHEKGYKYYQPSVEGNNDGELGFNRKQVFMVLYRKVNKAVSLLQQVKLHIIQYTNVLIGDDNEVNGTNNVVIGSRNELLGNNNWIFASDYDSDDPENGVLIINDYLIQLYDAFKITYNPREAIHCVSGYDSKYHFNSFWNNAKSKRRYRM